ncbi:hypothetical protein ACE6H2_014018 [Prunus campanulata]
MMSPPSCRPQLPDLPVGPSAPHVPASSESSVAQPMSARRHELLGYINRLFADRYKQWKSDLHHHFQAFDDPQAALQEGCPKELEGREDSWQWLCGHFQEADYVKMAKANKGNREKKTLLHHSGSRPFSYRMDARRREGSKFPEIDVFGDVYVRPGNELAESLHDAGFQILTDTLDQTLGRRPGTYCRGMGNARRREPRSRSSSQSNSVLTAKVAQLETQMAQMAQIIQSMAQSGVPVPSFVPPSTSAHGHQTSAPVPNVQTSEPHLPDEEVDLASLFN